jgi:hypothetical protein
MQKTNNGRSSLQCRILRDYICNGTLKSYYNKKARMQI